MNSGGVSCDCGLKIRVVRTWPLHCRCGRVHYGNGVITSPSEREPREHGPGTEIHRLLTSLGVAPTSSCGCASLAAEWDRNGVEWCREHRDDVLVPRLLEAYRETDWSTVFAAAARGATHLWLVKRLNPLHPIRSGVAAVVDEAIERAERD